MFANLKLLLSNALIDKGLELVIITVLILIVAAVTRRVLFKNVTESSARRRIRKTITRVSIGLILLSAAMIFSSNLGALGVSLGVAGAGIAFALQSVIANAAARLANSTGAFYHIGDRIQLGGVTGDVISINMMVTSLMEIGGWVKGDQYNGRVVQVANSSIFTAPIYHYSADFPIVWDEITIPIKYGGDRKLAVDILTRAATEVTFETTQEAKKLWSTLSESFQVEDARVEPLVTLVANDNWLEYNVRYVSRFDRRRITKSELCNRIMDDFDQVADRLGIASSTYDIVGFPPITINLAQSPESLPAVGITEHHPGAT